MRELRKASLAILVPAVEDEESCRLLTAGDLKSMSEFILFTKWYLERETVKRNLLIEILEVITNYKGEISYIYF